MFIWAYIYSLDGIIGYLMFLYLKNLELIHVVMQFNVFERFDHY